MDLAPRITKIAHPFINYSLSELGIISEVDVEDGKAFVEFSWPFPEIPIRQQLIDEVDLLMKELEIPWTFSERVMDEEERQYFLALEKKGWKNK